MSEASDIPAVDGHKSATGNTETAPEPLLVTDEVGRKHFEDILDEVGAFGAWQRVLFFLICVADIHAAFALLSMVYLTATPEWTCLKAGNLDNVTLANQTAQCDYGDDAATQCTQFLFHGDFTSIISEWGLVCGQDYLGDLITTLQFVGLFLGSATGGQLADLIGRKKTYFLVQFIMLTFVLMSAFANSWKLYAACRLLIGVGFGAMMVVAAVYPMEFVGKSWRVFTGTIGFWAISSMLLALLAYWLRDWRHLTLAISLSGFPYFLCWFLIPESPRWLIGHERYDEALEILKTIARRNRRPAPSIDDLKRLRRLDVTETTKQRSYTHLDIFRSWELAKRSIIISLAWLTIFVIYYEITYSLKHLSGDRYINMLLSGIVDQAAMISVIAVLTLLGRRKGLLFYTSLTVVCLIAILVIILTGEADHLDDVILGCSLAGKAAALGGVYTLQVYTAELFPTVVRNLGVSLGAVSGRVGGALAPQFVYLGTHFTAAPYIICAVLASVALPLSFLLPETLGKPLQDKLERPHRTTSKLDTAATIL